MPESRHEDKELLALGRAVRRIREQQGMSTRELAGAIGIRRERIEALETGRVDPTFELLLAVAAGLGTQPSALVTDAERLKGADEP